MFFWLNKILTFTHITAAIQNTSALFELNFEI